MRVLGVSRRWTECRLVDRGVVPNSARLDCEHFGTQLLIPQAWVVIDRLSRRRWERFGVWWCLALRPMAKAELCEGRSVQGIIFREAIA